MGPSSSRDFQQVAAQRFATAEFLLEHKYNIDAAYLSGYAVECSLKALILAFTRDGDRGDTLKRITAGGRMHNPEVLAGELIAVGRQLPADIVTRFRRWRWSVALRYEWGRGNTSETVGFLKTAKAVYDWVEGQLP